jgi:8-oxo-dGTP pyrophosphatase MutT (NUDIX family)
MADRRRLDRTRRRLEPLIRRAMHVYWRFARGLTLGVRAVVIDREGQVFLVQHSYVAGWHLPGGGVESGETIGQALRRELAEEGNIVLDGEPELYGLYFNRRASPRDHVAVFVVRTFHQDAAPVANREIVAHGFFSPEALPFETSTATRARISEVLNERPPSAEW